jgi:predicted RNA-binding protein with PIN domain
LIGTPPIKILQSRRRWGASLQCSVISKKFLKNLKKKLKKIKKNQKKIEKNQSRGKKEISPGKSEQLKLC